MPTRSSNFGIDEDSGSPACAPPHKWGRVFSDAGARIPRHGALDPATLRATEWRRCQRARAGRTQRRVDEGSLGKGARSVKGLVDDGAPPTGTLVARPIPSFAEARGTPSSAHAFEARIRPVRDLTGGGALQRGVSLRLLRTAVLVAGVDNGLKAARTTLGTARSMAWLLVGLGVRGCSPFARGGGRGSAPSRSTRCRWSDRASLRPSVRSRCGLVGAEPAESSVRQAALVEHDIAQEVGSLLGPAGAAVRRGPGWIAGYCEPLPHHRGGPASPTQRAPRLLGPPQGLTLVLEQFPWLRRKAQEGSGGPTVRRRIGTFRRRRGIGDVTDSPGHFGGQAAAPLRRTRRSCARPFPAAPDEPQRLATAVARRRRASATPGAAATSSTPRAEFAPAP